MLFNQVHIILREAMNYLEIALKKMMSISSVEDWLNEEHAESDAKVDELLKLAAALLADDIMHTIDNITS